MILHYPNVQFRSQIFKGSNLNSNQVQLKIKMAGQLMIKRVVKRANKNQALGYSN